MDPAAYYPDDEGPYSDGNEYELRCTVCDGYFEAAEETDLCPDCEAAP